MHILIVDDDGQVLRALDRRFRNAGYTPDRGHRVSVAVDGNACQWIVADDGPVDVIFMDGNLGAGDDGPSVVLKLREAGCTARIIMTSSAADMSALGIQAGANASCDKVNLGADTAAVLAALGIPPP